MRNLVKIVKGSTAPIDVQLIDVDSDSGEDPEPLTGAHGLAGTAQHLEDGDDVTLIVELIDAPAGKLRLTHGDFPKTGVYGVQVEYRDAAGRLHIVPTDGDSYGLEVTERFGGCTWPVSNAYFRRPVWGWVPACLVGRSYGRNWPAPRFRSTHSFSLFGLFAGRCRPLVSGPGGPIAARPHWA